MVDALTFPISLTTFFDTLEIESVSFSDPQPQEISRLADGTVLKASLGATLWQGSVKLWRNWHDDQMKAETLLAVLQRPGASFFIYDTRRIGPQSDPMGTAYGASTPSILSLDADNKRMSLQGLPAGYVLQAGDMLSFQYGSPNRYALHRIVQGDTANGSGVTGLIEVSPFIRTGAAVLDPVQLVKPFCKAVLQPSPGYGAADSGLSDGGTFGFIQTLIPGEPDIDHLEMDGDPLEMDGDQLIFNPA